MSVSAYLEMTNDFASVAAIFCYEQLLNKS